MSKKKGKQPSDSNVVSSEDSTSHKTFKKEIEKLITESESISGRDASAIKASSVELEQQINNSNLSVDSKKKMLKQVKKLQEDVDIEDKLEKTCGRVVQVGLLITSLVPLLITFLGSISEFVNRPTLIVQPVDLSQQRAVIVGGCGSLGSEVAMMLAASGSSVILGCRDYNADFMKDNVEDEFDDVSMGDEEEEALRYAAKIEKEKLRASRRFALHSKLMEQNMLADEETGAGTITIWPIDLESFSSVSSFADRVVSMYPQLELLIHVAATKEGCTLTEDNIELSHQVNFLSPALLTQLLLPALGVNLEDKNNHADYSARIIYTTCDAALQLPDWLPWPMRRVDPVLLPRVSLHRMSPPLSDLAIEPSASLPNCNPLNEYANSKLSAFVHTKELARRLNARTLVVSHIVNPGAMDTPFGLLAGAPTQRVSTRAKLMSYLPPVWISRKLWSLVSSRLNFSRKMLRDVKAGAALVFHVSTSRALSDVAHVGGLYADTAGVNVNCAKEAWECSRVSSSEYPNAALNRTLALELWKHADSIIQAHVAQKRAKSTNSAPNIDNIPVQKKKENSDDVLHWSTSQQMKRKLVGVEIGVEEVDMEVDAEWD